MGKRGLGVREGDRLGAGGWERVCYEKQTRDVVHTDPLSGVRLFRNVLYWRCLCLCSWHGCIFV